eukprot:scaffold210069_cov19-Tisochrysis_lutea.AAC.1
MHPPKPKIHCLLLCYFSLPPDKCDPSIKPTAEARFHKIKAAYDSILRGTECYVLSPRLALAVLRNPLNSQRMGACRQSSGDRQKGERRQHGRTCLRTNLVRKAPALNSCMKGIPSCFAAWTRE